MKLQSIWQYHRHTNTPIFVDAYIVNLLLQTHDIETVERHAYALQCCFRRLERAWQRVHKYDHAWSAKLARDTGKPICVWLNESEYNRVVA